MTDIVERLRHWSHGLTYDPATGLMHEAAAEIERLRNVGACPHVRGTVTQHCILNFTLTDEERAAIEIAAAELDDEYYGTNCKKELAAAATLRILLERLHA